MPWCDTCSRFWNPSTLTEEGACPTCGRVVAKPSDDEEPKAPWHFKVLVGLAGLYLGWRAVEGVIALVGAIAS
jgi:hypothetical protein